MTIPNDEIKCLSGAELPVYAEAFARTCDLGRPADRVHAGALIKSAIARLDFNPIHSIADALLAAQERPTLVEMFNASAKPDRELSVHQRVEAWLEAHRDWADATPERRLLRSQWRTLCRAYGGNSDVARGVLLGIVRLAWGCDAWRRLTIEPAGAGWCIVLRNGRHRPPSRAHAGWDLDRVAHPRYRGEVGPFGANEFACEAEGLLAALEAAPC